MEELMDGDAAWVGFNSRLAPEALPPGMLARSENLRLDRGTCRPRKGAARLGLVADLDLDNPAVILPFTYGRGPDVMKLEISAVDDLPPIDDYRITINGVVRFDLKRLAGSYANDYVWELNERIPDGVVIQVEVYTASASTVPRLSAWQVVATYEDGTVVTLTGSERILIVDWATLGINEMAEEGGGDSLFPFVSVTESFELSAT